MSPENLVHIAAYAGEIMLSNGAEISRIEDTVARMLLSFAFDSVSVFVVPSGIFVSSSNNGNVITVVLRVRIRTLNLEKICAVNDLSRKLAEGSVSPDDTKTILDRINSNPPYPLLVKTLAIGAACFCFTYMFGGDILSAATAFFISAFAFLFNAFLDKKKVSGVLCTMITGALIACLSSISSALMPDLQMDKVIIGGIMQLVPGLGLTNAIRDAFGGDYTSAASRLLDAVLIAVSIATGVGAVLRLWMFFTLSY